MAHCRSCGHQWTSHGDDKAPQWEPACWFLVNGVRCPCTGYAPAAKDAELIAGLLEDAESDRALVAEWDATLPELPE